MDERKPVHKFRYGNVQCCIFADNSSIGYFFHTTFARVFKEGEELKFSHSFDDRDLPNVSKAAADAHTWIYSRKGDATVVTADSGE